MLKKLFARRLSRHATDAGGRLVRPLFALLVLTAMSAALPPTAAFAQASTAFAQGPFTIEQANAGETIYAGRCAACHLPNLQGGTDAPQLSGGSFRSAWGYRPAAELLEYVRTTMPPSPLPSLDATQAAAV